MTVFDLPLIVVGPAILLILVGFSLGALKVFRRHILPRLRFGEGGPHVATAVVSSIMVFYGLALALIAVHVWETYEEAAKITSLEATSLATLYRDVSAYPEPTRSILRNGIKGYDEQVIHEAWPQQRRGRIPLGGVAHLDRIQATRMSFEPHSERERQLSAVTLAAYNDMMQARRMRVDAVDWHLPGVMWLVVIFGAIIGVVAAFYFPVPDWRLHATLIAMLA